METRIVYLVRHGEIRREDDLPRYVGQLDVPLSGAGRRQARALARRLGRAGLGAIVSSDLSRSVETARIVADAAGLSPTARADLREVALGEWEGRTFQDIERAFPDQFRARGEDIAGYRPPRGESFLDCSERVVRAFHEVIRTSPGDVLVVGHAGVNRLLLCHVLGMLPANLFRLGQDYGCVNVLACRRTHYSVRVLNGGVTDLRAPRRSATRTRSRSGAAALRRDAAAALRDLAPPPLPAGAGAEEVP